MTVIDIIRAVERDRQAREAGLSLYLLALARRARTQINGAIRNGFNWVRGFRGTFLGDEALDLPSGVEVTARVMGETLRAGVNRGALLAGVRLPVDALPVVDAAKYRPAAQTALTASVDTLEAKIGEALREALPADRISADLAAVKQAFQSSGWTAERPFGARRAAESIIVREFAMGLATAYGHPLVAPKVTGLEFVTVQDERRTEICRVRHGVQLPTDDPYWEDQWPALHWGCRSFVRPLTGLFTATYPKPILPQPQPNFGYLPVEVAAAMRAGTYGRVG